MLPTCPATQGPRRPSSSTSYLPQHSLLGGLGTPKASPWTVSSCPASVCRPLPRSLPDLTLSHLPGQPRPGIPTARLLPAWLQATWDGGARSHDLPWSPQSGPPACVSGRPSGRQLYSCDSVCGDHDLQPCLSYFPAYCSPCPPVHSALPQLNRAQPSTPSTDFLQLNPVSKPPLPGPARPWASKLKALRSCSQRSHVEVVRSKGSSHGPFGGGGSHTPGWFLGDHESSLRPGSSLRSGSVVRL